MKPISANFDFDKWGVQLVRLGALDQDVGIVAKRIGIPKMRQPCMSRKTYDSVLSSLPDRHCMEGWMCVRNSRWRWNYRKETE
jgi:hypothetical protein